MASRACASAACSRSVRRSASRRQQHEADRGGKADRGIADHRIQPFPQDRGAGPADRDIDRIVRQPLVGDDAAFGAERRAAGDDAAGSLVGDRLGEQFLIVAGRRGIGAVCG